MEGNVMRAQEAGAEKAGGDQAKVRPTTERGTTADRIQALQSAAGNAAVTRAVQRRQHQHSAGCGHTPDEQRELVDQVVKSPGSRMNGSLLKETASWFQGEDFSSVKLHTDTVALQSAKAIGARAYTAGENVVWDGKDKPTLIHELQHVKDQRRGAVPGTDNGSGLKVSSQGDWGEKRAEAIEAQARSGPPPVQRAASPENATEDATEESGTRHASGGHAVQRAIWTFNGSTRTHHALGQDSGTWFDSNGQTRTTADLQVDSTSLRHGDKYDDVTRQLHSSGAVGITKRGTIADHKYPQRENRTRKAVVEAQEKMAAAQALLSSAGGAPSGLLLQALKSAFPLFQTATPQQIGELVPRISEVLRRVQVGLNSQGAQIALVGQPSMFDTTAKGAAASGAAGWVAPSTKDYMSRMNPDHMKSEELPSMDAGRTGPINLREEGEVAWYVIHEATHRFAGTLDYQYSSYDHELSEDAAQAGLATVLDPATAATHDAAMLGKRVARDPATYTGDNETQRPQRQQNWYAMGRRALMNADSYAHFVMTATGSPIPRS
ncbi:eCIS core domain-containing protein [Streptomyces sp. NPDC055210]